MIFKNIFCRCGTEKIQHILLKTREVVKQNLTKSSLRDGTSH